MKIFCIFDPFNKEVSKVLRSDFDEAFVDENTKEHHSANFQLFELIFRFL